jgi:hypothetical protein
MVVLILVLVLLVGSLSAQRGSSLNLPSGLRKMSWTRCRTRASAAEMPPPLGPVILLSAFLPALITYGVAETVSDPAVPVSASMTPEAGHVGLVRRAAVVHAGH